MSAGDKTVELGAAGAVKPKVESESDKKVQAARQKAIVDAADKENGLTPERAAQLLAEFGPNELADKKRNPVLLFLSFFWGPMPCMIWAAIIIELAQAIVTGEAWVDFAVLMALQFANAIVGFVEEFNAGNAIDALKQQLAPQANVIRGGVHSKIAARELVPGDLIEIKLGDVIPADAILLEGRPVQVDQAALTGESLPATAGPGSLVMMSSALKQGHIRAIIVDTGKNTFIGRAAGMMASVQHQSNLHRILLQITIVLLIICIIACACIFARLMTSPDPPYAVWDGAGDSKFLRSLSVVVVILVASIPVAIEVVVTSTMAVGSHVMASKKVIVARLSAIEELAGMTVLCSDKTGTLTLNKLSLKNPILLGARSADELTFYAALASKREGDLDAIDYCIAHAVPASLKEELKRYIEEDFAPFDPISKRTVAIVRGPDGARFKVSKGAPQVTLRMSWNKDEIASRVKRDVDELAARGFRSLGVAVSRVDPSLGEAADKWEYLGVLSLFDPPRPDSKETIEHAIDNGVMVKMITGDHGKIAKETCRELGMGTNILNTEELDHSDLTQAQKDMIIMEAHGFAEVMPEHKFLIVERIQKQGNIVGMTGDGVNDAPALKRADIGIAVHGATDAARAAAAIVLTEPGINVIIDAIFESRKIFQRMRNYIIYRIACTLQLLFFFFFGILCIEADTAHMYNNEYKAPGTPGYADTIHAPFFSLPVLSLVIITILNDGCMITISGDLVVSEKRPQNWDMWKVWVISLVLGAVACLSSLILLAEGMHANWLHPGTIVGTLWGSEGRDYLLWQELKCILYLKISVSDFLTLFSARTRTWFWERCLSRALLIAFFIATGASTLLSLFWADIFENSGGNMMAALRHSPGAVVATWVYCILWWVVQDAAKKGTYYILDTYFMSEEEKARNVNASLRAVGNLPKAATKEEGVRKAAEALAAAATQPEPATPVPIESSAIVRMVTAASGTIGRAANALGPVGGGTLGRVTGIPASGDSLGAAGTGMRRLAVQKPAFPNDVDMAEVIKTARQLTAGRGAEGAHPSLASIFPGGPGGSAISARVALKGSGAVAHADVTVTVPVGPEAAGAGAGAAASSATPSSATTTDATSPAPESKLETSV